MKVGFFILLILAIFAAAAVGYYFGYDIGFEETVSDNKPNEYFGNALAKTDLIRVSQPRPNEIVQSPLVIKGEARGLWFFEASFPVRLIDENGKNIPLDPPYIMAASEWMTENFVPFEATLTFDTPQTETGTLVFEKDNPSGLPENADSLVLPIKFSSVIPKPGNSSLGVHLGEVASALGVSVIPKQVLEDSRCPADVVCVWEGRVRLKAILKSASGEAEQIFTLGEPTAAEAENVTLIEVGPAAKSGRTIDPDDYIFIFKIAKRGE